MIDDPPLILKFDKIRNWSTANSLFDTISSQSRRTHIMRDLSLFLFSGEQGRIFCAKSVPRHRRLTLQTNTTLGGKCNNLYCSGYATAWFSTFLLFKLWAKIVLPTWLHEVAWYMEITSIKWGWQYLCAMPEMGRPTISKWWSLGKTRFFTKIVT